MLLWDTLCRWLCHHETPYVDWYIIKKLWDTLYRWLCHHGTPYYVDGYIINEKSKCPNATVQRPKEAKRTQIHNDSESQQNNVGIAENSYLMYVYK